MTARGRLNSQGEVDDVPTWRDIARQASRAVERVCSDDTGVAIAALSSEEAEERLNADLEAEINAALPPAKKKSGTHELRLVPRPKVAKH